MKNPYRFILILSAITMLATGCGSHAKTLEPSFANYTANDLVDVETFDGQVAAKDYSLSFEDIQYTKTSYEIESSETLTTSYSYKREKGTVTRKIVDRFNTAKLYNHYNNVLVYDSKKVEKEDAPGINKDSSMDINLAYQIYNQQVVVADKNNKVYEIIQSADIAQTFGGYVAQDHAISNKYVTQQVIAHRGILSEFVQDDIPLLYYYKKNLFTIGITYKDRNIPIENDYYNEKMSVSAVCQISTSKNSVSVNVQYEVTYVMDNFSSEYIEQNDVDYSQLVKTVTLSKVVNLNIGGTVIAATVDMSGYSIGNVDYQCKNPYKTHINL